MTSASTIAIFPDKSQYVVMLKSIFLLTFIFNLGWALDNLEEGVALYKNNRY